MLDLHKRLRLRVAAYACHEHAREKIAIAIRNTKLASARLHFNAYFCEIPVIWPFSEGESSPQLMAPFIDFEIARRTLNLDIEPDAKEEECISYLNEVNKAIEEYDKSHLFHIPLAYTNPTNVVKLWEHFAFLGPLSMGRLADDLFKAWCKERSSNTPKIISSPFLATDCVADIKAKLASEDLSVRQKIAYVNIFALLYYALMTSSNRNDCLYFVATPICTQRTFHGLLIAVIEAPRGVSTEEDTIKPILHELGKALMDEVTNTYLPTLILSQNSWEEHILYESMDTAERTEMSISEQSADPASLNEPLMVKNNGEDYVYSRLSTVAIDQAILEKDNSNDLLETALIKLWARRQSSMKDNLRAVKESLIFRKMMAASPGMIDVIREVACLGLDEPKGAPLQAVLVVAPPGSGKEMISRLIPIFSSYFWDKPVRSVNMGSILLETQERKSGLHGFFENLADKDLANGGTLVLDELNSLDIAAQPILLRVLEEGEISFRPAVMEPLGKAPMLRRMALRLHLQRPLLPNRQQKTLPWLVVGLINEDPARLTLETLQQKVTEPIFGDLLGSALYEHWKGKSRLRDDLYYRIRRCGEIRMRGLNDRRPDIPIVFYFRLRTLLQRTSEPVDVFLTYEAMRKLIDPSLDWKGNMRKLEALARQLKGTIERQPTNESILRIDDVHIEKALQDIGMCKRICATCGQHTDSKAF